ncbi:MULTISPECIES: hypothetical protein [Clostridium]|uniref:Uncharacterized protein n=1 Tax=Clostridium faecium TaxID=2762223 RepID=A0ABR8YQL8_9CLOT|nr:MULTISPECIES: hypothetical protein [Clostridium]MBD8046194.1 hypothetical protein [Clostridium faecium]MDU1350616.1 hypothetical protein [Clostridium argentinense]
MFTKVNSEYLIWQFKNKKRDDRKAIDDCDKIVEDLDLEYAYWQFDNHNS